ncbi:uncharacterized protein LOC141585822 isoform X2 [Silene latifolia]|uniref:uncharacterized protein LOC141585822 isoform X2 n=1 Tax=Silene latifolia TaxID=37657 RepID=UPI003D77B79D
MVESSSSSIQQQVFKGANVFMSRNLVPPEVFDALHDALKLNGAHVFLCSDPSRNSPHDFHVISSDLHDKFDDLRAKGCNLLGPQCILSCAKERRPLPKLGYVCCLAMDGVKVLASGFVAAEKERIGKLVTAMSGSFESKSSSDVSFVIVKTVLAGKYKWAASKNKHIVTINWLNQCWIEHRVVPLESYRVPPFLGLTISVTRVAADERKEMEKLIIQNGGKYSAELTKLCTHLICEVSEGDKFKVARKWGTISIVTRKWFDQSLAKRVCLNEEAYQVQSDSVSSASAHRNKLMAKPGQDRYLRNSQPTSSSAVTDSSFHAVPSMGNMESDLDVALSQNISNISSLGASAFLKEDEAGPPDVPQKDEGLEVCVAEDSEPDDLYLSDCKICLIGFNTSDTRKLLGMVRRGGGSRYMFCNERLTHIIVGAPSDVEKRELRGLAALGVIRIVKRIWLEDCDRAKKEVPVAQKHIAYDILLPKDALRSSYTASDPGLRSTMQVESLSKISNPLTGLTSGVRDAGPRMPEKEVREDLVDNSKNGSLSVEQTKSSSQSARLSVANGKHASLQKIQLSDNSQHGKLSKVFARKCFQFSHTFPKDKSDEVVQWINEGGGEVLDAHRSMNADFIVECHGVISSRVSSSQSICVSSHWIMSCLKEGRLIDVRSHILYSPLPCRIPLPGFETLRFCVSQYSEKDRLLLRNLCFVLGAKFGDKLTKKVTHLLCNFANGPKYEAACKWGVHPVRCEWIYECVKKNEVVTLDNFYPEQVPQDPEPGLCTVTQYPTQAAKLISTNNSSQISGESQDLRKTNSKSSIKRLRPLELSSESNQQKKDSSVRELHKKIKEDGHPDVAAVIEDLLEQTSKIQDLKSPVGTSCEKTGSFRFSLCLWTFSTLVTKSREGEGGSSKCFRRSKDRHP